MSLIQIKSDFFKNLFSVGFSSLISKILGLIILGYPARILGPQNYGIYTLAISVTAFGSIILLPGLNNWGSRKIAISNSNFDQTLIIVNFTRLILSIFAYILILLYSSFFIESQITRVVISICALNLFSTALSTEWVFNGLEMMRFPSIIGMITSVLNVICVFFLLKTPQDLILYSFFVPVFTFFSSVIFFYLLIKKGIKFKFPNIKLYKLSLKSSFYLSITSALVVILHYANNFIVNYYLGSKVLGFFMASYFLLELISMIPVILGSVFQSKLAREYHSSKDNAIANLKTFAFFHVLVGVYITAFVFSEADFLINFIYGYRYSNSAIILKYMSFGILFNFLIMGYTNSMISLKVDRMMLYVVSISSFVSIVGGLILVPKMGALGASIIISIIDFSGWLISLPFYISKVGKLEFRKWLRPIFGGICVIFILIYFKMQGISVFYRLSFSFIFYIIIIFPYLFSFIKIRKFI